MKRLFWLALFVVGVAFTVAGCACGQKQVVAEQPTPPPPVVAERQPTPPPPQPVPPPKKDRN